MGNNMFDFFTQPQHGGNAGGKDSINVALDGKAIQIDARPTGTTGKTCSPLNLKDNKAYRKAVEAALKALSDYDDQLEAQKPKGR